ncbi:FAD-dependent oxidoreductase [Mycobacterium sp.]|uniref:FAD-dependent oxidoreductase n=1 Tax=Mycobacterium sp. TaxID=1785 RepID=UPI003F9A7394
MRSVPEVAIIGGGFAGIGAAVKLTKADLRDFTIFEKADGIGGTWWENRYPGAEVDVHSQLYSYSFRPNDWSRTHARQAELQRYLEEVVDEYGSETISVYRPGQDDLRPTCAERVEDIIDLGSAPQGFAEQPFQIVRRIKPLRRWQRCRLGTTR